MWRKSCGPFGTSPFCCWLSGVICGLCPSDKPPPLHTFQFLQSLPSEAGKDVSFTECSKFGSVFLSYTIFSESPVLSGFYILLESASMEGYVDGRPAQGSFAYQFEGFEIYTHVAKVLSSSLEEADPTVFQIVQKVGISKSYTQRHGPDPP